MKSDYARQSLLELSKTMSLIDPTAIESVVDRLALVKQAGGRVFVLGAGGSAAIASHAVIDLRKGCRIDAHAPTDGVEELTARTNDDGWDSVFAGYCAVSRIGHNDLVMIFSIGGGDAVKGTSLNIIKAIDLAKSVGAAVVGVVGKSTGHTAQHADALVLIDAPSGPVALAAMAVVQKIVTTHPHLTA